MRAISYSADEGGNWKTHRFFNSEHFTNKLDDLQNQLLINKCEDGTVYFPRGVLARLNRWFKRIQLYVDFLSQDFEMFVQGEDGLGGGMGACGNIAVGKTDGDAFGPHILAELARFDPEFEIFREESKGLGKILQYFFFPCALSAL